ncbi:protein kinase [Angomonas deanei]|uniref:non-specific serine/threonine protein kinase n=1 Tax=Angomonas deanei TaxID=59799 RepID=A0A7G2CSG7_9TRYP|nr:protein kinase [Angomonas deanei]CAD2222147.1 Protein tyrosine kinase/Protein kinase domain containing protein, putative [Angomonas deanei]|eukprot:EPY20883.1 protein kinase [Angomonas deanei]
MRPPSLFASPPNTVIPVVPSTIPSPEVRAKDNPFQQAVSPCTAGNDGSPISTASEYSSHYGGSRTPRASQKLSLFAGEGSRRQARCPPFSMTPSLTETAGPAPASVCSTASPSVKARRGPVIRLSHNKLTLVAGVFRVSREGCSTVRNVLLLNPKRIDQGEMGSFTVNPHTNSLSTNGNTTVNNGIAAPNNLLFSPYSQRPGSSLGYSGFGSPRALHSSIPPTPTLPAADGWAEATENLLASVPQTSLMQPSSSFTLQSAVMNTPYSPITYSMDNPFPSANSPRMGPTVRPEGGTLLKAARDAQLPRRLCTLGSNNGGLPRIESVGSALFSPPQGDWHPTGSLIQYADLPHIPLDGSMTPHVPPNAVHFEDLLIKDNIGEGASATVSVAIHKPTGRRLAVKRVDLSPLCLLSSSARLYTNTNSKVRQLQHIVIRELQVLHLTYRSPFMVKVYNAYYIEETQSLDIVMEFMHYGSLDLLASCLQKHARTANERVQEERRMLGEEGIHSNGNTPPVDHEDSLRPHDPPRDYELEHLRTPLSTLTDYFPKMNNSSTSYNYSQHTPDPAGSVSPLELLSVKSNAGTEDSYEEGCVVEETYGVAERIIAVVGEQLLRGVRDMHHRGYIHRDIKPGNVLVNEHGVVKLSDFGLSQRCDAQGRGIQNPALTLPPPAVTHCNTPVQSPPQTALPRPEGLPPISPVRAAEVNEDGLDVLTGSHTPSSSEGSQDSSSDEDDMCSGTDKYMSPERQRGEPHGRPSDVWAVGVTLAEFAVGQYPYNLHNVVDVFERVHRLEQPIPFDKFNEHRTVPLSSSFQDFIALATLPDPASRPTAEELLEHPFFRQWKSPFNLKEYLSERVPVPSNAFKEEFLRENRRLKPNSSSYGMNLNKLYVSPTTHRSSSGSSQLPLGGLQPGDEENSNTYSHTTPNQSDSNRVTYQVKSLSSLLSESRAAGGSGNQVSKTSNINNSNSIPEAAHHNNNNAKKKMVPDGISPTHSNDHFGANRNPFGRFSRGESSSLDRYGTNTAGVPRAFQDMASGSSGSASPASESLKNRHGY